VRWPSRLFACILWRWDPRLPHTHSAEAPLNPRRVIRYGPCVPVIALVMTSCDVLGLGEDCTSNAAPVFTHMFTDLTQVRSIVPLGTPSSGGEIKERHQVQVRTETDAAGTTRGRNVPIVAAARARLQSVRRYQAASPPAPYADEYYGFVLEFSCEVTARFDHIRTAGAKLAEATGAAFTSTFHDPRNSVTFEAGEVIGHTDGTPPAMRGEDRSFAFDYALYNSKHENPFLNSNRYRQTRNLRNSLHAICGGSYYTGSLRSAFDAALGYYGQSAGGNCRSASRDVAGSLAGGWFRAGAAEESSGWRLAFATEYDGAVRLAIHPSTAFFFTPVLTSGSVNRDPAQATGTSPYCYTDRTTEFYFQLSADGRMSMAQRPGTCSGSAPTTYTVQWER